MPRLECSVLIAAPPTAVFAYAADWRRWPEWFEGVSDVRSIGEIAEGNGARYAYKVRLMAFRAEVVTEIADVVENVGWTGIGRRGMPHKAHWNFEPCGDQTRFTYVLEYRVPPPVIGALVDRWSLRPQWRRILERSLESFKRRLEASRPAGGPVSPRSGV